VILSKLICLGAMVTALPVFSLLGAGPVVAFGDSTTAPRQGLMPYAARLASLGLTVINAGVPGNNTDQARARLDKDVLAHHPAVVIVQFGLNDAAVDVWKQPPESQPRIDVATYRKNLAFIVGAVRRNGGAVILMTPNPMSWTRKLRELYGKPPYDATRDDGMNVVLTEYLQVVRDLAKRENAPLVDVYQAFGEDPRGIPALLLDGMHPNDAGHEKITKMLIPVLRSLNAVSVPNSTQQ
jgi:lysophospholipase L1-like esterase